MTQLHKLNFNLRMLCICLFLVIPIFFGACQFSSGTTRSLFHEAQEHLKTTFEFQNDHPDIAWEHYQYAKIHINTLLQRYPNSPLAQSLRNKRQKINGLNLEEFFELETKLAPTAYIPKGHSLYLFHTP